MRSSVLGNWVNEKSKRADIVAGAQARLSVFATQPVHLHPPPSPHPRVPFFESPSRDVRVSLLLCSAHSLNPARREANSDANGTRRENMPDVGFDVATDYVVLQRPPLTVIRARSRYDLFLRALSLTPSRARTHLTIKRIRS